MNMKKTLKLGVIAAASAALVATLIHDKKNKQAKSDSKESNEDIQESNEEQIKVEQTTEIPMEN